jgi:hypothetical protein
MLMTPFLPKWTYTRQHEQIAGGQKYRPPSVDVNAPDLFIPLMAAWAYALLCCVVAALGGKFKPDLLSSSVSQPSVINVLNRVDVLMLHHVVQCGLIPSSTMCEVAQGPYQTMLLSLQCKACLLLLFFLCITPLCHCS